LFVPLLLTIRAHVRSFHSSWFDHPSSFWWGVVIKVQLCSRHHYLPTSPLLSPNSFDSILMSNILVLCPSVSVRDQVSHPYTTSEFYFLCYKLYIIG
jgi:hypothetical protein